MIPGSNLLNAALTLIASQPIVWIPFAGRVTNAVGQDVNTYAAPIAITRCSVQAVQLDRYERLGLDLRNRYVNVFVPANLIGINRDRSADVIQWNGRRFEVINETPWYAQDGWVEVLAVDVGVAQ